MSLAAWKRVAKLLPTELHGYAREWGQAVERMQRDPTDYASSLEWKLWRSLCAALREADVVTDKDLLTSVRVKPNTKGQRLLCLLRHWGDLRRVIAEMTGAEP